jgi:hypothetical protein
MPPEEHGFFQDAHGAGEIATMQEKLPDGGWTLIAAAVPRDRRFLFRDDWARKRRRAAARRDTIDDTLPGGG